MKKSNTYELMVILRPDLDPAGLEGMITQIEDEIKKRDGEILLVDKRGSRKLAFKIKRQRDGIYVVIYCRVSTGAVSAITRKFNITESVLRHMFLDKPESEIQELVAKKEAEQASKSEVKDVPAEVQGVTSSESST